MLNTSQTTATDQTWSAWPVGRGTVRRRARRGARRRSAWVHRRRADPYPLVAAPTTALAVPAAVTVAGGSLPAAGMVLLLVLVLSALRSDPPRPVRSALDEAPALTCVGLIAMVVTAAAGLPVAAASGPIGVLQATACYGGFSLAGRAAGYGVIRALRRRRRLVSRAVIIGTGRVSTRLVEYLREHPEYGHHPIGVLDRGRGCVRGHRRPPVVGSYTDLPAVVRRHRVHAVFVTFSNTADAELVQVIRDCHRTTCEIYLVPRPFELGTSGSPHTETVWGVPCRGLRRAPFRHASWQLKRLLDLLLAAVGLVLTLPLMLLIAVSLRITSGSGVLFRQQRLTRGGRSFHLLKFRTMRPLPADATRLMPDEERVTRLGRILRRSSLDELPQLWNVLAGHMSLVGPRPEQPALAEQLARIHPGYAARLRVPAGLTGLAQVHDLRGDTSIEDRARLDNLYIETWSLWLDVKILVQTVGSVALLRGR